LLCLGNLADRIMQSNSGLTDPLEPIELAP
jgi:hypothetical protein